MNLNDLNLNDRIKKNDQNFYQLKNIPNKAELKKYYEEKYFQSGEQYSMDYDDTEIAHIEKKVELKIESLKKAGFNLKNSPKVLELGVGEGWTLSALKKQGCKVTGLDFSDFAVKHHNPDLAQHMVVGDVEDNLDQLIKEKKTFDLIWLDNVLEHTSDPQSFLKKCHQLGNPKSFLMIEVPNDFSAIQMHLLNQKIVDKPYWIVEPDHVSYFSKEGLSSVCKTQGWKNLDFFSDFPIEVFLFNENTNYSRNKAVGKSCHKARINFENFLMNLDSEKALNLFRSMASMGLGRQIVGIFNRD